MQKTYKVIGLMSGSSMDGLDIAYCQFQIENDTVTWQLLKAETLSYPEKWQIRLSELVHQNALAFAKTHTYFGRYMGELVNQFIQKHQIDPDFIASHGHTIFHYPMSRMTMQIGDGAALAALTGLPVINNFRTHDVALDGEGAPLAPIADKYLFPNYDFYMNIGGIANITCNANGKHIAFDIGPANQVLNILANQLGLPYDDKGQIAQQGKVNNSILSTLNQFPYFLKQYPKSLDNNWIHENIFPIYLMIDDTSANKLRTACEHLAQATAVSIATILRREKITKTNFKMLVTGGGAWNDFLMKRIHALCNEQISLEIVIPSSDVIGFKEAMLMGLMGVLRVENKINCLKSVTGAKLDSIGGAIWQGTKKYI